MPILQDDRGKIEPTPLTEVPALIAERLSKHYDVVWRAPEADLLGTGRYGGIDMATRLGGGTITFGIVYNGSKDTRFTWGAVDELRAGAHRWIADHPELCEGAQQFGFDVFFVQPDHNSLVKSFHWHCSFPGLPRWAAEAQAPGAREASNELERVLGLIDARLAHWAGQGAWLRHGELTLLRDQIATGQSAPQ